ncbi:hypothetical protein Gorai_019397 [Gossypium raimondii]|uniref:Cytochrome P450 n=1 Tax=Gossypium raimondii TaxID=29730 RepID=A0A7J8PPA4_GOSRA|nr:hypothetical protein [Gossypium raimondii]
MKRVQSFAYAREDEVDKLITSLSQALPKPVNLNKKIFTLVDGIIGTVAFGKIYGTDQFKDQVFHNVLGEAMNMLVSFSAEDFFPRIGRIDALTGLSDHARLKPEQEDFVDFLIRLMKDESNSFKVSENCMKAMLFDEFIDGIVTTSTTILWAMSELIKNPRRPQRLGKPSEFYPERFDGSRIDFRGPDFNLLPFGAGHRICPGLDMGATNVEFTLANMLYWFHWELPNDMKREDISIEEEDGLACQRRTPLWLVLISNSSQVE